MEEKPRFVSISVHWTETQFVRQINEWLPMSTGRELSFYRLTQSRTLIEMDVRTPAGIDFRRGVLVIKNKYLRESNRIETGRNNNEIVVERNTDEAVTVSEGEIEVNELEVDYDIDMERRAWFVHMKNNRKLVVINSDSLFNEAVKHYNSDDIYLTADIQIEFLDEEGEDFDGLREFFPSSGSDSSRNSVKATL